MGLGIEYIRKNNPLNHAVFIGEGQSLNEDFIGRRTRISITASVDGKTGTVFVAGNTRNLNYHLFKDESDEVGRRVKPDSIEESGKEGVFVKLTEEQQLLITTKKRKIERSICFTMCASSEAFLGRVT